MTEGKAEGKPADAEGTAPHDDGGGATAAPTGHASDEQEAAEPAAEPAAKPATKPAAKPAAESSGSSTERKSRDSGKEKESKGGASVKSSIDQVRSTIATVVWVAAVLCAVVLAAGALVVALDFNARNDVVKFLTDTAESINFLGDMKTFEPDGRSRDAVQSARTKEVLVNWGICAVVYLVGGKILDRLIRP
jgi:hypothetical protein